MSASSSEEERYPHYVMEQGSRQPKVAIIASEPLSLDRYAWLPIPSNSLVVVNKNA